MLYVKTEKERIEAFDNLMRLDDNTSVVSDEFRKYLITNGFFKAPASTKYHGSYEGGLYDHSESVTKHLLELTSHLNLKWEKPRSPYIIGMFHDLCKIDAYKFMNGEYVWNQNQKLNGHGGKSVALLSEHIKDLTLEENMCVRYHMGAYVKSDEWSELNKAISRFHNVLWTQVADMEASQFDMT